MLFQTADNCMSCHNNLVTPAGEDVSIGIEWQTSMMANSARDPYWQAAVRREDMDAAINHTVNHLQTKSAQIHIENTEITAELKFQPIAFRWAQNLSSYDSNETNRFVGYFNSMSDDSHVTLASTSAIIN